MFVYCAMKMINYLERQLKLHVANEKLQNPASGDKDTEPGQSIDPQIFCTLGHLNLLLENYPKGCCYC